MNPEESSLIARSTKGDLEAFSALVREHQTAIRAYLVVRVGDKHEADDLAQEVFLTAYERLDTLQPGQPFAAWLRRIALNHFRNHRRKFRAAPIGDSTDLQILIDGTIEKGFPGSSEDESVLALRECLGDLEGPAQSLLHDRYIAGFTVREIAARTKRGYSALTMQLHRLRNVLADCIRMKVPHLATE